MSTASKILLGVLALAAVAFGAAFLSSRYLVSRLNGTGGVLAPTQERYSSEDGVSFLYPSTYGLSSRTEGNGERRWDVLVLLPKSYAPPQNGEGPPAITLSVFDNVEQYPLEVWIKGDAKSNWKLAAEDATLASTTVGGEPALAYEHTGLYETKAVAVAHRGKIFLFEVGRITPSDQIVADFQILLTTVHFTP